MAPYRKWLVAFHYAPVLAVFDLLVPCVTYCEFARLTMALYESRGLASADKNTLFVTQLSPSAMICIAAQVSLVSNTWAT